MSKPLSFPLTEVHNKAKTERQLSEARERLRNLSLGELGELLTKVKYVNGDDPDARPWISIIDDEIALRLKLKP